MLKNEEYNAATQKSKYGNDKSQVNLWLSFFTFCSIKISFSAKDLKDSEYFREIKKPN